MTLKEYDLGGIFRGLYLFSEGVCCSVLQQCVEAVLFLRSGVLQRVAVLLLGPPHSCGALWGSHIHMGLCGAPTWMWGSVGFPHSSKRELSSILGLCGAPTFIWGCVGLSYRCGAPT